MELKQQFIEKAEKYFDACVTDNEQTKISAWTDMRIIVRRERALYLAKRQPKQIDQKPKEAETVPLITDGSIWCKKHPVSNWGINPKTGTFYARCSVGFKKDEDCSLGTD